VEDIKKKKAYLQLTPEEEEEGIVKIQARVRVLCKHFNLLVCLLVYECICLLFLVFLSVC
jgi:hypothetical protein